MFKTKSVASTAAHLLLHKPPRFRMEDLPVITILCNRNQKPPNFMPSGERSAIFFKSKASNA